jgi:NAD+ synthase
MKKLSLYLAQLNMVVGDFDHNIANINFACHEAKLNYADIVVFPELAITGYPAEDLVLRHAFQLRCIAALHELAKKTLHGPAIIIGTLWLEEERLYNAAAVLDDGKIKAIIGKQNLPNYGVFDEMRLFDSAPTQMPVEVRGVKLGVMICEDFWVEPVSQSLAAEGAEMLIAINASPFERDKHHQRIARAEDIVTQTQLPLVYLNQIGGQDELVFDGGSFVMNADKSLAFQAVMFAQQQEIVTLKYIESRWQAKSCASYIMPESQEAVIYDALKLSLYDYIEKNGFPGVIIGMSGGIDSALTAAIAVDALGAERVKLVMMPSQYTSQESLEDAQQCADYLGVVLESIAITPAVETFSSMLAPQFEGREEDTTEENIQSRIRGLLLMAMSNKLGHMVLTTGNKSEMAVGYATLYGDMCGGFNVLKDLYKMEVFALSRWRNSCGMVIPERIITKPPSAELRPDQTDEASLPPYVELDHILHLLIEKRESVEQLIHEHCLKEADVTQVARLVKLAEYKRRQAPPGTKIGALAFGKDRRYPITHRFGF